MERQKSTRQAEAVRAITQAGGNVHFDHQWTADNRPDWTREPDQPAWLRKVFGDEFFARAVAVDVRSHAEPEEASQWIPLLPYLRYFNAAETPLSDAALVPLGRAAQLRFLDLRGTSVTDRGLAAVAALPQLQTLSLAHTRVTDTGLVELERGRSLRELDLSDTDTTELARRRLAEKLPQCRIIP